MIIHFYKTAQSRALNNIGIDNITLVTLVNSHVDKKIYIYYNFSIYYIIKENISGCPKQFHKTSL